MTRRAVGFVIGLALLTFVVAWVALTEYNLPLHDPDSVAGPAYIRLPAIVLAFYLLDVIPRVLYTNRGFSGFRRDVVAYTKRRWTRERCFLVAVGLGSFYLVYLSYRNLKNLLPWVFQGGRTNDGMLQELDRALLFGHNPPEVLHALLGTGISAHVLSAVYVMFLGFVPVSLGVALIWSKNVSTGFWYVIALCVNWVLGAASYFWIPAVGSFWSRPEWYMDLPTTAVSGLQADLVEGRYTAFAAPYAPGSLSSIAAFASLHVSIVLTAALICHLVLPSRTIRWAFWVYFALTATATIYFGWHYLFDDIAGVGIGYLAVWIGAKLTGHSMHPHREHGSDDDGVLGTFPPATESPAGRRPNTSDSDDLRGASRR